MDKSRRSPWKVLSGLWSNYSFIFIFVVIFLEQWLTDKKHINAIIGLLSSLIFLILLGPDNFMIPAMVAIVVLLTLLRKKYNIENDTKPQNESEKPESQKTESTDSNRGK